MTYLRAEEARIVVALDFGTTFSGFAYALRAEPKTIYNFYEWPLQALGSGRPYCKTQTSLWYMPQSSKPGCYKLNNWGWPALLNYSEKLGMTSSAAKTTSANMIKRLSLEADKSPAGYLLTRFKLHLANTDSLPPELQELPPGMSVETAISDYLSALSQLAMKTLNEHLGRHIAKDDVQWCITIPAIWDVHAKQQMKMCAEMAGLVAGSACRSMDVSPHRLLMILEPEAASLYCQQQCSTLKLRRGDKVLVADFGGGTVDIVVHEIVTEAYPRKVREISRSTGGLFGASYVDDAFFEFLSRKISCFRRFTKEYPAEKLNILKNWSYYKHEFDGSSCLFSIDLPLKLAEAWEESDCRHQLISPAHSYDEIDLDEKDMKEIFNPVVDQILALIGKALPPDTNALMMVGGFSSSPYLMRRINEKRQT